MFNAFLRENKGKAIKVLSIGPERGREDLKWLSGNPSLEIYSVNSEKRLLGDLKYMLSEFPEVPKEKMKELYERLSAKHAVMDISREKSLDQFTDGFFDAIVMQANVAGHIRNQIGVLEHFYRKVKKGGVIFTELFNIKTQEKNGSQEFSVPLVIKELKEQVGNNLLVMNASSLFASIKITRADTPTIRLPFEYLKNAS